MICLVIRKEGTSVFKLNADPVVVSPGPHMNLYLYGQKPDPGLQTVPTSAEAVFYVDRANALQYR